MFNPREEKTLVLIKPDGVRKGLIGEVIARFEQRDLKIVALGMVEASRKEMDGHYPKTEEWLKHVGDRTKSTYEKNGLDPKKDFGTDDAVAIGKEVRTWLVDFMSSAPMVKMVVQGPHAVEMVRKITGATLPALAAVGTIRGDFAADSAVVANMEKRAVYNIVHASETVDEAKHEIAHWFDKKEIFKYTRHGETA